MGPSGGKKDRGGGKKERGGGKKERGGKVTRAEDEVRPDELYDQFPSGTDAGYGPAEGFNRIVRLNDPELFTERAREDPVIREFLDAPFSVSFVQFKSSHREAEVFIHMPDLVMAGRAPGVEGAVDGFPAEDPHIGTYVINHDRTLAKKIMRSLIVEDGKEAGQIIHKQAEDDGR